MANLSTLYSGQLAATTTPQQLGPTQNTEKGVFVNTTANIYVGGASVTATTGMLITSSDAPVLIPIDDVDQIWVVAASSATVSYLVV